ncbi:MAG: Nre family DNA repair protein [Desulfurococcaceae archaeon]|nr:Nre family DNA repair protein [Desulfurococcaceae archaeon]
MNVDPALCILCRGGRNLCGKAYCPILTRYRVLFKTSKKVVNTTSLFGSSPPAVFVGRYGYPYVYVGPMAPPEQGDTSRYDFPESWADIPIDRVVEFRTSLVLGRVRHMVTDVDSRIAQAIHELVLSVKPTDIEMIFDKPPRGAIFSEYEPPIGPRANLTSLRVVGSTSSYRAVEKFYSDTDVKALQAVIELYRYGIPISHIQKLLSVGALGRKGFRRFVPTRWAITAVDNAISKYLVEKYIKNFETINSVQVFVRSIHKNLFISILVPGKWCFEWMEAWFPGSTWNIGGAEVVIEGDHELFTANRDTYAAIGGCYYAARLATAEYLCRVRRQAIAIVLREIYPGFDIPIGVWFVREQLRAMYNQKPYTIDSLEEAIEILDRFSVLKSSTWIRKSYLLKKLLKEYKLNRFIKKQT